MFFDMCDVDMGNNRTKHTKDLTAVKPLPDRAAFRVVGDREIWHLNWGA
jgi:hypothetical protein